MDHLLKDVVDFTVETMRAHCAFVGLLSSGQLVVRNITPVRTRIDAQEIDIDNDGAIGDLVRFGRPLLIEDFGNDCSKPVCDFTRRYGFRSFVGVPIIRKNEVVGVICCFSENTAAFSADDSYFLGLLASQLAIALDNARLFEEVMARNNRRDRQLAVAQKLQKDRMPDNFKQNVAALTCRLRPADELAGDFCDVFTLGRNSLAVVVGDVANKGIAASLMTFSILSMFRNVARIHKPPCEVLKSINRSLISQVKEDGWFATAFYAKLNTSNGILTYSWRVTKCRFFITPTRERSR